MKKSKESPCRLCGARAFDLVATRIREGRGRIIACRRCGLVQQGLAWDAARLRRYYEREYQQTNSLRQGESQTPREHYLDRNRTIGPLFAKIRPLLRKRDAVLEVGCGAGSLLARIKPLVRKCVGLEVHTPFVDFVRDELGIAAQASDLAAAGLRERFDLIICISTLDHLPDPLAALRLMKRRLAPGGRLYLEVPNRDEALNFFLPPATRGDYNRFFWHRAHYSYFTRATLAALCRRAGLTAAITCRHDYTLKNFLQWYFAGRPQPGLVAGMAENRFFAGTDPFARRLDRALLRAEQAFKRIMAETFRGDSLCCVARRARR